MISEAYILALIQRTKIMVNSHPKQ